MKLKPGYEGSISFLPFSPSLPFIFIVVQTLSREDAGEKNKKGEGWTELE